MRSSPAAIILVTLTFSGCLGVGLLDVPEPTRAVQAPAMEPITAPMMKVRELLQNTTCEASVDAGSTSPNLKELASLRLPATQSSQRPVPGQIDTYRNRTVIAFPNAQHYTLVNTTDPAKPLVQHTYAFLLPGGNLLDPANAVPLTNLWDAVFSSDGNNVVVGVNNRLYAMDITGKNGRYNPQGGALQLPPDYGGQAQRVAIHPIGGIDHVFVAPGSTGSGLFVARLSGSGAYAKLDPIGLVTGTSGQATGRISIQPTDMAFRTEWLNGSNHTFLYAANGAHGILVLDVSQPLKPEPVSTIAASAPGPGGDAPYYNSIQVTSINGTRLLIASQIGSKSVLKVWDLTDFKAPKQLAAWTLDPSRAMLPQAETTIANATLFLAHHQEGLWGFDLAALAADPASGLKPILRYQPAAGGSAYDVSVEDGLIHLSDAASGTHKILGYGCFPAGDRSITSTD